MGFNVLPLIPLLGLTSAQTGGNGSTCSLTIDGMIYSSADYSVRDWSFNLLQTLVGAPGTISHAPDFGIDVFYDGTDVYYFNNGSTVSVYKNKNIILNNIGLTGSSFSGAFGLLSIQNGEPFFLAAPNNGINNIMALYDRNGNINYDVLTTVMFSGVAYCNVTTCTNVDISAVCVNSAWFGQANFSQYTSLLTSLDAGIFFDDLQGLYNGGPVTFLYPQTQGFLTKLGIRYNGTLGTFQMLTGGQTKGLFYVDGAPVNVSLPANTYVLDGSVFPAVSPANIVSARVINGHPVFLTENNNYLTLWGIGIDSSLHGVTSNYSRLF